VCIAPPVTKSLCAEGGSSRDRDAGRAIVTVMDIVAVVLGLAMFAILILMIEGIDRV
jgi:hypothetical protein